MAFNSIKTNPGQACYRIPLVETIRRADAKDLRGKAIGRKAQPLLVFVVGSYVQSRQNVIANML
jgi:hypothetical protein